MAEKFKLNKSELTRLKRNEKTYNLFLPVLKLKQEQLQIEQIKAKRRLKEAESAFQKSLGKSETLTPLLSQNLYFDLLTLLKPSKVIYKEKSIAGIKLQDLEALEFPEFQPAIFGVSPWVSDGLPFLIEAIEAKVRFQVIKKQYDAIAKELRKATQKVNLFDQVLIPETKEAIRKIKIALGDEQVAQVGRGKIAKAKKQIEELSSMEAVA